MNPFAGIQSALDVTRVKKPEMPGVGVQFASFIRRDDPKTAKPGAEKGQEPGNAPAPAPAPAEQTTEKAQEPTPPETTQERPSTASEGKPTEEQGKTENGPENAPKKRGRKGKEA